MASLSFVTSHSATGHLVLATVSSEIAETAAEAALTAVVKSDTVAEVLLVLAGLFCDFSSTHELKMLLFLGGGELGILIW